MSGALVRRLQPNDAEVYRALRLRALREHAQAFTSSYEEESLKDVEAARRRLAPASGNAFWGAFLPQGIVGMVGLDREQRMKNRHKAHLVGMYVAPEAGRRGIGRMLVDAVLAEARRCGVELLLLTVTHGNRAARDLYARCGFETFGIEPDAIRIGGKSFDKEHMFIKLSPP